MFQSEAHCGNKVPPEPESGDERFQIRLFLIPDSDHSADFKSISFGRHCGLIIVNTPSAILIFSINAPVLVLN